MFKKNYNNTNRLLWFYLRKDCFKLLLWTIGIVACTVGIIAYFPTLYATTVEKVAIVTTMSNPAMVAMAGPIYGQAPYTIAELAAQQMLFFTTILAVLMNIGVALKNTRAQEEEGMLEMISSLPIGRYACIVAVFIELLLINGICAILIGFGLNAFVLEGATLAGTFLFGLAMMGVGLVFGCATIVFAQLASNLRSAQFLAYLFFGGMYLFRASTDISNRNLSWLSPMAWSNKTEVFVNNNFFPIFLVGVTAVVLMIIAMYFNEIRDIGGGLIASRPGKKQASRSLGTPFGLVFRLERTSLVIWLVAVMILGASYGSVFGDMNSFMSNETIAKVIQNDGKHSLAVAFIPTLTLIIALFTTIPCIGLFSKLVKDEQDNQIEQLYAFPLSRKKHLFNHLLIALALAVLAMLCTAVVTWSVAASVMNNPIPLKSFVGSAIAFVPAIMIMIGLAMVLLGWLPRKIKVLWLYLISSFMLVYFGNILQLPSWVKGLSPYGLIPRVPLESFDYPKFIVMLLVAVILFIVGFVGYRRRDITT